MCGRLIVKAAIEFKMADSFIMTFLASWPAYLSGSQRNAGYRHRSGTQRFLQQHAACGAFAAMDAWVSSDTDVPLRLHAPEIGSSMLPQALLWIQNARPAVLSGEHHPMPERPPLLKMPFDGQQCEIRECVPGMERHLRGVCPQTKAAKQFAHMGSI